MLKGDTMSYNHKQIMAAIATSCSTSVVLGQNVVWDGDCGDIPQGSWDAICDGGMTTNWDHDMIPTDTDNVLIQEADVRIFTGNPRTINALSMMSASLTGSLELFGGNVADSSIFGSIDSGLLFLFTGNCNYSGGTLTGTGIFGNSGTLTFNGFIGEAGSPTTFANAGTAYPMFEPHIGPGSIVNNAGTIEFLMNRGFNGEGTLINNGTIILNLPAVTVDLNCTLDQAGGTIFADAGELRFNAPSTYSGGEMVAQDGGTLTFGGLNVVHEFQGLSRISGQGIARFNTGPSSGAYVTAPMTLEMSKPGRAIIPNVMLLEAPLTNRGSLLFDGARITGDHNGLFINEGGSYAEIAQNSAARLLSDVKIINRGTVNQRSACGPVGASSTLEIVNESGGVWEMVAAPSESVRFTNRGTVYRRTTDQDPVIFDGPVPCQIDQEGGTLDLREATTTFVHGGTWSGGAELTATSPAIGRLNVFSGITDTPLIFEDASLIGLGGPEDSGGDIIVDGFLSALYQVTGSLQLLGAPRPLDQTQRVQIEAQIAGPGTIRNRGGVNILTAQLGDEDDPQGTFINEQYCQFSGGSPDIYMSMINTGLVHQHESISVRDRPITNQSIWRIGPHPVNGQGGSLFSKGSGTFVNLGSFIAENFNRDSGGSNFSPSVWPDFDNQGTVFVSEQMTLTFHGDVAQVVDGVLVGGNWVVEPLGILSLPGPIDTIGTGATVTGGTASIPAIAQIRRLRGRFTANQPLNVPGGLDIEEGGELRVQSDASVFVPGTLSNGRGIDDPDGPSTNSRLIPVRRPSSKRHPASCPDDVFIEAANFENHAVILLGEDHDILQLTVSGAMTLHETSHVNMDLGGPVACVDHDQIEVQGHAIIGGILEIDVTNGYMPGENGYSIVVATGGVSGNFDSIMAPIINENQRFTTIATANEVLLVLTCAADLNGDTLLNFFDVSLFLSAYTSGDPLADFSSDGVLDFFDVSSFLSTYQAGCPEN